MCYSISLDESTDVTDTAQLCIFIRGINLNFEIFEEMLAIVPLNDQTTGEKIFKAFRSVKVISVSVWIN